MQNQPLVNVDKSVNPNMVIGVDIGSTKISTVICELDADQEVHVRGIGTSVLTGVERGAIVDVDLFRKSLERAIRRAEISAGAKVGQAFTNFPFHKIQFVTNTGVLASREESGQITQADREEVLKRVRNFPRDATQTILHLIPKTYRVDGNEVKNPVGVFGTHLEVDAGFVLADAANLQTLTQCFSQLGVRVKGIIYDGLSLGQILLTQAERDGGIVIADVGGRVTQVHYFKNGLLQGAKVIPVGGESVSADVAYCLKVTLPEAERLKIIHGDVLLKRVDAEETIQILTKQGRQLVKRRFLCQIIEARVDELWKLVRQHGGKHFEESREVILSGDGALLNGMADYVMQRYAKSVRDGVPEKFSHNGGNLSYSVALGSILYGLNIGALQYYRPTRIEALKRVVSRLF